MKHANNVINNTSNKTFLSKIGLTLAEVLVTLAVIGVISAMTIPTLLQNTGKLEYASALKKEYAAWSQAFLLINNENGGNFGAVITGTNPSDAANLMNTFATRLKLIKNCGTGTGCWYDSERKWLNGTQNYAYLDSTWDGTFGKAIVGNGTSVSVDVYSPNCTEDRGDGPLDNVCADVTIDINGKKAPNTIGRDYFYFWITKNGVYPYGSYNDGYSCDPTKATWAENRGCAAKIIKEGAMNY